jgi:hypothetical protein
MPTSFDYSWSSGPFGPAPLLWLLSQGTSSSEWIFIPNKRQGIAGSSVYQVSGAMVEYGNATTEAPPIFRRTTFARVGSRGIVYGC